MIEFKNLSGVRLSESEWNSLMKGVMPVYNQLKKQHGEITLDLIFQVNKVEMPETIKLNFLTLRGNGNKG